MLVPWFVAPGTTATFYIFLVLVMSPICFVLYGIDRRRAARQELRISERTLHLAAFAGGWPGAWLGQRVFHHRTDRWMSRLIFRLILLLHVSFLCLILLGLLLR